MLATRIRSNRHDIGKYGRLVLEDFDVALPQSSVTLSHAIHKTAARGSKLGAEPARNDVDCVRYFLQAQQKESPSPRK